MFDRIKKSLLYCAVAVAAIAVCIQYAPDAEAGLFFNRWRNWGCDNGYHPQACKSGVISSRPAPRKQVIMGEIIPAPEHQFRRGDVVGSTSTMSLISTNTSANIGANANASTSRKVTGSPHYNSGMQVDLPQGQNRYTLTLTVSDQVQANSRDAMVQNWFNTNPRLKAIKSQVRWNHYAVSNPLFRDRIKAQVGTNVPIVTMQTPDARGGNVILNYHGTSLSTADDLADAIYQVATEQNPRPMSPVSVETNIGGGGLSGSSNDGCHPKPNPAPAPSPNPLPVGPLIPEVGPNTTPPAKDDASLGLVMALAAAGGLARVVYRRKTGG